MMITKPNPVQFSGKQRQAAGFAGIIMLIAVLVVGIALTPIFSKGALLALALGPIMGTVSAAVAAANTQD